MGIFKPIQDNAESSRQMIGYMKTLLAMPKAAREVLYTQERRGKVRSLSYRYFPGGEAAPFLSFGIDGKDTFPILLGEDTPAALEAWRACLDAVMTGGAANAPRLSFGRRLMLRMVGRKILCAGEVKGLHREAGFPVASVGFDMDYAVAHLAGWWRESVVILACRVDRVQYESGGRERGYRFNWIRLSMEEARAMREGIGKKIRSQN